MDLDREGLQPQVVVNAILVVDADSTDLQLSLSKPVGDTAPWTCVPGSRISLFENGVLISETYAATSIWSVLRHPPIKPATTYRIEADVPGYGKVWGETRTPQRVEDGKIDIQRREEEWKPYKLTACWRDHAGERNSYWLGASHSQYAYNWQDTLPDTTRLENSMLLYTNSSLPDPFNRVLDEGEEISVCYEYYIRIEDSGLDGQQLYIPFHVTGHGYKFVVFLLSTDEHYDAWLKSSIQNKENSDMMEDLPLIYQPAYTYSNIHGGVGIVGSYVRMEKTLLTIL